MSLALLFSLCLSGPYTKVGVSASYALKRVGKRLYIFFQDSDGKTDWKNNLDFPAKAYKRMDGGIWFAHRGFLKVWKEIEPFLAKDITDNAYEKIIVCGYSHGGALALLCHEYVWYHRPDLRETIEGYGFGCPRVFWGFKGKTAKKRFERFLVVRNIDDLVTHLPPRMLGYTHVGKMLKIGKRGKYTRIQAHYAENIQKELLLL